jgi:beta-1,4-N-acetylglucosaminyltransferase
LEFASTALRKGYRRLVVQRGNGEYQPHNLKGPVAFNSGLQVEFFDYSPSLMKHMEGASLIISHAGSGSIFESLSLSKPLIVVPNPLLMDNHQEELGQHLAALGHLACSSTKDLIETLGSLDVSRFVPYAKDARGGESAASAIVSEIDRVVFA